MNLDIIVPVYNEEKSIKIFADTVNNVLKDNFNWKIIFVDDGSTDNTLDEIKKLDGEISYISFSRNFGKESAIYAGLKYSSAEFVILMDVDLQDPVEFIPEMFNYIDKWDMVATRRVTRKGEPLIRSFFARCFYRLMDKCTDLDIVDGARDFRLMKREVVRAILEVEEYNRFSKGIFQWIGFKTKWLEYENIKRANGETSWSFWKLVKYSIEGIISFTTAPLHISTIFGVLFSVLAFISIIFIVVRTLLYGDPVGGWPSTISVILFIGGVQLFSLGILGQYLAKTYLEVKNRPIYIVKEENVMLKNECMEDK